MASAWPPAPSGWVGVDGVSGRPLAGTAEGVGPDCACAAVEACVAAGCTDVAEGSSIGLKVLTWRGGRAGGGFGDEVLAG